MAYAYDFVQCMEDGKARAQERRNRGLSTGGKVVKIKHAPVEIHSFDFAFREARHAVQFNNSMALEDYLRAVYPERYDIDDLPF